MIVAAAILKDGVIYTGRRHHEIINDPSRPKGFMKNTVQMPSVQGFTDDKGNFLTREEAGAHAIACGQIKELKYHRSHLFSEEIILTIKGRTFIL